MKGIGSYVLVVDDLRDAADSMAEMLGLWGYAAEAHYGGASALATVRLRPPAVVLLDIIMAPMDGFAFVAHFRKVPDCAHTPIVAISGHATEAYRIRSREIGIAQYLYKPVDPKDLRSLIGRLLTVPEGSTAKVFSGSKLARLPSRRIEGSEILPLPS